MGNPGPRGPLAWALGRRLSAGGGRGLLQPSPARPAAAPRLREPEPRASKCGPGGSAWDAELGLGTARRLQLPADLNWCRPHWVSCSVSRRSGRDVCPSSCGPGAIHTQPEVFVSLIIGSFSVEPSQPLAQSDKDPGPTRTFTVVPRAAGTRRFLF